MMEGASSSSSSSANAASGDDSHPPLFGTSTNAVDDGTTRSINLDDIFADCFFGPSTDSLPASTSSAAAVRGSARGGVAAPFAPGDVSVPAQAGRDRGLEGGGGGGGGGVGIDEEDDDDDDDDDDDEDGGAAGEGGGKKRKRPRPQMRQMTEQQKVERR